MCVFNSGKDVDSIVRDLVENALSLTRSEFRESRGESVRRGAEEKMLDILVGSSPNKDLDAATNEAAAAANVDVGDGEHMVSDKTRERFRTLYREGILDDVPVEVDAEMMSALQATHGGGGGGGADMGRGSPGAAAAAAAQAARDMQDVRIIVDRIMDVSRHGSGGGGMRGTARSGIGGGGSGDVKRVRVRDLRPLLEEEEASRLQGEENLVSEAVRRAESDGIVFIDEIDKICRGRDERQSGADASSEGVQRDLLPIIEGSTVTTKYGAVKTDHMLFICSGAFHAVKPSDLLAELQGRLPIRVTLDKLGENELHDVLTTPKYSMLKQQQSLLATEGVDLVFSPEAVRKIASAASKVNDVLDNIGARRLHTVLEKIMEEVSFRAPDHGGVKEDGTRHRIEISEEDVDNAVNALLPRADLMKYVL